MSERISEAELKLLEERTPTGSVGLLVAEVRRLRGLIEDAHPGSDRIEASHIRARRKLEAEAEAIRKEREGSPLAPEPPQE